MSTSIARPQRVFGIFLAIQACALLIATFVVDRSSVFRAILPAQAALAAILLSVGPIQHAARFAGANAVGLLFAIVVTCLVLRLDMGGLLGMHGFGWQFLMMTVRTLIVGAYFWRTFLRNGYMLSASGEPMTDSLLRFRLHHFFILMFLVALFLAITRNLAGGPFYGLSLVAYVILLGFGYALMDLMASLLTFERAYSPAKIFVYTLAILAFSLAIAAHAYASMSGWPSAMFTWLETMVEVCWIGGSLLALRSIGFRLAKKPVTSISTPAANSVRLRQSLRFSLKTFVIVLTLFAVWLGWNVSVVRKRDRLREMIEGRPRGGGIMAVVTYAEGDASAPKQVKERIAPHVLEALDIRNRGGRVIGPSDSTNLSLIRRWLGDELVFVLLLNDDVDIDQFAAAFPEAMIVVRDRPNARNGP